MSQDALWTVRFFGRRRFEIKVHIHNGCLVDKNYHDGTPLHNHRVALRLEARGECRILRPARLPDASVRGQRLLRQIPPRRGDGLTAWLLLALGQWALERFLTPSLCESEPFPGRMNPSRILCSGRGGGGASFAATGILPHWSWCSPSRRDHVSN